MAKKVEKLTATAADANVAPLRIALLILMPNIRETEAQFSRLLRGGKHTVEITLLRPGTYKSRNWDAEDLVRDYKTWQEVADQKFDGLVVTGAPVEDLAFEDVAYWSEMQSIFDWAETHVGNSLFVCWAAQAVLVHRFGIEKNWLGAKASGVFEQQISSDTDHPVFRGMGPSFKTPVSRSSEMCRATINNLPDLEVLASSGQTGMCLLEDKRRNCLIMFNHLEYDTGTLAAEFERDTGLGIEIGVPENYFPGDDPSKTPMNDWQPGAAQFFRNWLSTH